jgi:hypothetical protein
MVYFRYKLLGRGVCVLCASVRFGSKTPAGLSGR